MNPFYRIVKRVVKMINSHSWNRVLNFPRAVRKAPLGKLYHALFGQAAYGGLGEAFGQAAGAAGTKIEVDMQYPCQAFRVGVIEL